MPSSTLSRRGLVLACRPIKDRKAPRFEGFFRSRFSQIVSMLNASTSIVHVLPIRGAVCLSNEVVLAWVTEMNLRNTILILAVSLATSVLMAAQEQRPALVPLAQGAGSASAGSASSMSGASIGNLSDGPITPGEVVHINVFGAPDFSLVTRVSSSGDVPFPIIGSFHMGGLNSIDAATMLAKELKDRNLMLNPEVTVTVDSATTGITVLGEVHSPGVYPPPGKHQLSDLLATAGGLTANTGRIIEITNDRNPSKKEFISWDPTISDSLWQRPWLAPRQC
jgi:protein involved in polysaccharide export with SLBB domain